MSQYLANSRKAQWQISHSGTHSPRADVSQRRAPLPRISIAAVPSSSRCRGRLRRDPPARDQLRPSTEPHIEHKPPLQAKQPRWQVNETLYERCHELRPASPSARMYKALQSPGRLPTTAVARTRVLGCSPHSHPVDRDLAPVPRFSQFSECA